MNRIEAEFAAFLEIQKRGGDSGVLKGWTVLDYKFEAMRLKLAERTTYTPDFIVTFSGNAMMLIEIKGPHVYDDSLVKYKVASEMYPAFKWAMWRKDKAKGWHQWR